MCGIAGVVGLPSGVAKPRVREAIRRLTHRGPDGEGWHEDEQTIIGMRRLAIIDLECGDQPIYNEDHTIVAVCNGELYNYVEGLGDLRKRGHHMQSASDVNLIPHYYEEAGPDAFKLIRGMFAAAVWDARQRILTLARDRAGKKPLFYASVGNGLAFASELPALLALLDGSPPHSHAALTDYLQLGFIPHPETIYEGVFALPPGCTLILHLGGTPTVQPFWTPPTPAPFVGTREDALDTLDYHLREAVSLRLRSDVPVGMFLSGGIDSGLVAAYAKSLGAHDLLCFVVEVPDPAFNEGPAARLGAKHLGLPIETIPLEFAALDAIERVSLLYGQPFADPSAIPSYYVAKAAAAQRKVVLNGDGGDEVLGGYRRYWSARAAPWLIPITSPVRRWAKTVGEWLAFRRDRRSALGFGARILRGLGAESESERYLMWNADLLSDVDMAQYFPGLARQESTLSRLSRMRGEELSCTDLKSCMRSDYRLGLADALLPKMDMATMANSLEARSPFLDVPLAEFAWSLPDRWLVSPSRTKPLLRDLADSKLPPSITSAPKRGFEVPVGRWLQKELRPIVADMLLTNDSRVSELGNRALIRNMITRKDRFPGNYDRTVWTLLMLELFLRAPTPSTLD